MNQSINRGRADTVATSQPSALAGSDRCVVLSDDRLMTIPGQRVTGLTADMIVENGSFCCFRQVTGILQQAHDERLIDRTDRNRKIGIDQRLAGVKVQVHAVASVCSVDSGTIQESECCRQDRPDAQFRTNWMTEGVRIHRCRNHALFGMNAANRSEAVGLNSSHPHSPSGPSMEFAAPAGFREPAFFAKPGTGERSRKLFATVPATCVCCGERGLAPWPSLILRGSVLQVLRH